MDRKFWTSRKGKTLGPFATREEAEQAGLGRVRPPFRYSFYRGSPLMFKITTTIHNAGPHTIWGRLAERLGREPTQAEAIAEVKRILAEASEERATAIQRKRR